MWKKDDKTVYRERPDGTRKIGVERPFYMTDKEWWRLASQVAGLLNNPDED